MCGIAGIFCFHVPPDLGPLDSLRDAMAHRGPDDAHSVRFRMGGLAVRRLAIQDPRGGRQPISDCSGRFWVAMNGEIYNFKELRQECRARGTIFRTRCDTEVLVELVAALGLQAALPRLQGMFALAVYDRREQVLWLARDRMGQKPLFYTTLPKDRVFVFASELKALLRHPRMERRVDPGAIARYLLFEYIPAPRTIYQGIEKLEPGCLVRLDTHGVQVGSWWSPPVPRQGCPGPRERRAWKASLHGAFRDAALSRLVSDVPVGVLLSGGLDSTAVLATVGPHMKQPVTCFTLAPENRSFDESGAASMVAAHFSCTHNTIPFKSYNLPEVLEELENQLDEPLGDSSLPSTWWLMRQVSAAGFKVVLSGDGGDEALGGYQTYLAHRLVPVGRFFSPAMALLLRVLPPSYDNVSFDYQLKRMHAGLHLPSHRRNQVWMGAFLPEDLDASMLDDVWSEVDEFASAMKGASPECMAMALDRRFYLGDGVLAKVDRASQAHGVEVRSPFLDHRFVELSARVPSGLKLGLHRTKAIWREITSSIIPPELARLAKKGFGTPVGPWLKGSCTHLLHELEQQVEPWVTADSVRRWKRQHMSGLSDHRRRLWSLLVLARWLQGPWGPAHGP